MQARREERKLGLEELGVEPSQATCCLAGSSVRFQVSADHGVHAVSTGYSHTMYTDGLLCERGVVTVKYTVSYTHA